MRATQATIRQAKQVLTELQTTVAEEGLVLIQTLQTFLPRAEQVLEQTRRRVVNGESIPAAEKLVSIFEPHTDIICRGKPNIDAELGHKLWLGEVEGVFISQYRLLGGNPVDDTQWQPTVERHIQQFNHPPWQASGDRGVYSSDNEATATKLGVKRVILPKPGRNSQARRKLEHQPWLCRGRCFHAGVEGRVCVIKRKYGLGRCRNRGCAGFERGVGWVIIANNLTMMGRGLSS